MTARTSSARLRTLARECGALRHGVNDVRVTVTRTRASA
jgi:hypothetical protein